MGGEGISKNGTGYKCWRKEDGGLQVSKTDSG